MHGVDPGQYSQQNLSQGLWHAQTRQTNQLLSVIILALRRIQSTRKETRWPGCTTDLHASFQGINYAASLTALRLKSGAVLVYTDSLTLAVHEPSPGKYSH
jgi:hypothetical protein